MIGTGEAEATPAEAEHLDALFREMETMPPADSVELELERLIAEIPSLPDAVPADATGSEKPESLSKKGSSVV